MAKNISMHDMGFLDRTGFCPRAREEDIRAERRSRDVAKCRRLDAWAEALTEQHDERVRLTRKWLRLMQEGYVTDNTVVGYKGFRYPFVVANLKDPVKLYWRRLALLLPEDIYANTEARRVIALLKDDWKTLCFDATKKTLRAEYEFLIPYLTEQELYQCKKNRPMPAPVEAAIVAAHDPRVVVVTTDEGIN